MSTTTVPPVVAEVERWLSRFDEALTRGDSAGAAELFGQDSYWRDLVAFTWNITTVEGQAGVRDIVKRQVR
jgi:putative flavoprotein involved in K+ transport